MGIGVSEIFSGMIQRAGDSFIQNYIHMISVNLLATALKNVDLQLQEKIFRNMSKDSAEAVKQHIAALGGIGNDEIEAAQKQIIAMAEQVM